jgi:hypothetical protein
MTWPFCICRRSRLACRCSRSQVSNNDTQFSLLVFYVYIGIHGRTIALLMPPLRFTWGSNSAPLPRLDKTCRPRGLQRTFLNLVHLDRCQVCTIPEDVHRIIACVLTLSFDIHRVGGIDVTLQALWLKHIHLQPVPF